MAEIQISIELPSFLQNPVPLWAYVTEGDKKKKKKSETQEKEKEDIEGFILCVQCENKITRERFKREVQGGHQHTFLNPGGMVFEIGCFKEAEGAVFVGDPTSAWSWFQGYTWQTAICSQCLSHIGWFFRKSNEHEFYGLILNMLKEV